MVMVMMQRSQQALGPRMQMRTGRRAEQFPGGFGAPVHSGGIGGRIGRRFGSCAKL